MNKLDWIESNFSVSKGNYTNLKEIYANIYQHDLIIAPGEAVSVLSQNNSQKTLTTYSWIINGSLNVYSVPNDQTWLLESGTDHFDTSIINVKNGKCMLYNEGTEPVQWRCVYADSRLHGFIVKNILVPKSNIVIAENEYIIMPGNVDVYITNNINDVDDATLSSILQLENYGDNL